MTGIGVIVDVDTEVLEHTRSVIGTSAAVMRTETRRRVGKVKSFIRQTVKAPDDLPDLPFIWSYDAAAQARARRWYFANKVPKGSAGGRYQRTGKLESEWDISFIEGDNGAAMLLENDAPGAEFVWGRRQVPSHYRTGWKTIDEIVNSARDELNLGLIEDWFTASDPTAGIR